MLRRLIRKEILSHVLSLRFSVAFVLSILLIFASFYVTVNQHRHDADAHSAISLAARDRIGKIIKKDGWERRERLLRWEGRLDGVPPPPLSAVVQGLWPAMPIAVNTTVDQWSNIDRSPTQNPLLGLLRIPDFTYVVNVVLSLLAILFAFDAVCGEKESGTLRLILSNAVPRHSILLAKWIGGYGALIVPFLIAVAGGLIYAYARGALEMTGDETTVIVLLVAVAALYISVFFTLSLFISTTTHRATTALFVCLFVWVVWILVVPNMAPVVARIIMPAPSVKKINAEKAAVREETRLKKRRLTQISGELSYGDSVGREREKIEQQGRREERSWDRFFETAVAKQTRLAETLGRLSPSSAWTYAAVSLTQTGPDAYKRFGRARKRLPRDMASFGGTIRESKGKWPDFKVEDVPYLDGSWAGAATGKASRSSPYVADAVHGALNDVLILAILNVAFFMAAFACFLRYDVR